MHFPYFHLLIPFFLSCLKKTVHKICILAAAVHEYISSMVYMKIKPKYI